MKTTQRAGTNSHLINYVKNSTLRRDALAGTMGVRKASLQRWLDGTHTPPFWTFAFIDGLAAKETTREIILLTISSDKAEAVKTVLKAMSVSFTQITE